MTILQTQKREPKKALDVIRKEGAMPAIIYGSKEKSTPITVNQNEFIKAYREAGESTTITLKTSDKELKAIIQDVQMDPVKHVPIHVDFLAIDMNKPIEISVPIKFIGEAPVAKNGLGTVIKVLHELKIKALPKDLPHEIAVDLSTLQAIEDNIIVKNVKVPQGVTVLDDAEETVTTISVAKEEIEEEETAPVDIESIEVEKKGKDISAQESEESEEKAE